MSRILAHDAGAEVSAVGLPNAPEGAVECRVPSWKEIEVVRGFLVRHGSERQLEIHDAIIEELRYARAKDEERRRSDRLIEEQHGRDCAIIKELRTENEDLRAENEKLRAKVSLLQRTVFGRSSEKLDTGKPEDAPSDGGAVEPEELPPDEEEPAPADPSPENPPRGRARGNRPAGRRAADLSGLPVIDLDNLSEGELDGLFGKGRWKIVSWEEHSVVVTLPGTTYRVRWRTPRVAHDGSVQSVGRPTMDTLFRGSFATPSLLAGILHDKYVMGIPLYRQSERFGRCGLVLSRQTMSTWVIRASETMMVLVWGKLLKIVGESSHQQCDETHLLVVTAGGGYVWVHTRSELVTGGHPAVVYCNGPSRSADHLRWFFDSCRQDITLTSDGYAAYGTISRERDGSIVNSGCMMHCRRKFFRAFDLLGNSGMSEDDARRTDEYRAIELIAGIYEEEMPLKPLSPGVRLAERKRRVAPRVNAFFDFVHGFFGDDGNLLDRETPPSSTMAGALGYALRQETALRVFLDDGEVPIDNGFCERCIRRFAVGRRNWLFSYSPRGATASCVMYSLVETAILNGADPWYYMRYLLEEIGRRMDSNDKGFLDDMLPWSEAYREYERRSKADDLARMSGFWKPDIRGTSEPGAARTETA